MNKGTRRLLGAGFVIAALAAGGGLFVTQGWHKAYADAAPQPEAQAPALVPVSVATAERRETGLWNDFSGRLEAVERVEIRSRVTGAVQAVHFREGGLVQKGDLLITIDPAPYAAAVARYQAELVAAQARVALAKKEQDRAQQLQQANRGTISQSVVDQRVSTYNEAVANLRAAQAGLQTAQLDLGYTEIRAPIAGRVGRLEITVGNLIAAGPGAPVLTTLVSVSPIYASFDANERIVSEALQELAAQGTTDIARIPVQMGTIGSAGTPHGGKLQLIDNQVDARSGTVRVRAQFDNPQGLLMPGQFVRLRMGEAKADSLLLVSERAIGTDQDKKFVLVVGAEDRVAYREVTLGAATEDGLRVIASGLEAGERIVVNGLHRVRPGVQVAPQMVSMYTQPAGNTAVAQR
ncbi:efflux RND transporter periplasmic adaptor subunit [Oceanibaculum pacificum]|uniref:Efflux transporter periplasmic adaptor subunit n=1 Tax=Oceanibaculum pacificum TaxID=580166 RepID=A0A154VHY1_9PROT|nr:efflux RND transporter periplasmic adaptor subunit [Oceanibaculum pacificum]KZD01037.1 efflux transporter periplasmic adaptor subunit [Oceanibaculum pacificum]